jgi:hypothetical protein
MQLTSLPCAYRYKRTLDLLFNLQTLKIELSTSHGVYETNIVTRQNDEIAI